SAAFRNHMHWSEMIGGGGGILPPYSWQGRFNQSDIEGVPRIDKTGAPGIVDELSRKFLDFRRAYSENGLAFEEFDAFAPTRRTLRQFITACHDLDAVVRDILVPNPDA